MTLDLLVTGGAVVGDSGEPADVAIGIATGLITYLGPAKDAPVAQQTWDVAGRLITPGLVDCHTHLVFGGDRFGDFRRRLAGESYTEIAESGGGIRSTVQATREAATDELVGGAKQRLEWLMRSGVTTVEVKSGYGLTVQDELRMLRVAREAADATGIEVTTTLLGAHVLPSGADRAGFVEAVCSEMIPQARGLADAVDVFIERIAFTAAEADQIFSAARRHGYAVKAHAGQLSDVGGAEVAAAHRALSIDHCEHVSSSVMAALASAGTVAALVPGASLFLAEEARPPVAEFRSHGIPMAITTDLNPGSSPLASLPLAASLAIHRFGLTPAEAYAGITVNAAAATGLPDRGKIGLGLRADLAVWDISSPTELVYWLGAPMCHGIVIGGRRRVWDPA